MDAGWPEVDSNALKQDSIEIVLQVNGKFKGKLTIPADASRENTQALALAVPAIAKALDGLTVRKVIVVPKRLVNIAAS